MTGLSGTRFNRLVVASYRLPFKIVKRDEGVSLEQNSGGLVSAILSLSEKMALGEAALKFSADNRFDFILAMGDDRTDEDIFRALPADGT